jgi:MFS family permease
MEEDTMPSETTRLLGLCTSFFFLFFAFYGANNQVSSILGNFGTLSLGVLNGCFALSAVVAPAILRMLQRCVRSRSDDPLLGEVVGLTVGSVLYAPFIAACSSVSLHWGQMVGSALLGLAAGVLWVAQGSFLTALCTEANRGRWSGFFFASFMLGNAAGNFATAGLVSSDSVSTSTLFLVLAGVAMFSSVCFGVLTPARAGHAVELSGLMAQGNAAGGARGEDYRMLDTEGNSSAGGGEKGKGWVVADGQGHGHGHGGSTGGVNGEAGDSLRRDLCELAAVFGKPQLLVLAPLLLFIGCENAFWSGAFNGLVGDSWGARAVALVSGTLAVADTAAAIGAGVALDACEAHCPRWGPRAVLLLGVGAFCGGAALVVSSVRPLAAAVAADDANSGGSAPAAAFCAAALMGLGDGVVNTVATARLGRLAEDEGLLPRRTAFQYFQCTNVLMTGVSFVYMQMWPLGASAGEAPSAPAGAGAGGSLVQVWVLAVLAVLAAAAFTLFAQPVRAESKSGYS